MQRELLNHYINKEFTELFSFEKKSKKKASEGKKSGKYKFFTSSNVQDKYIDEFDFDGEFLVFGTGGNASIHYVNGKFSTSTDCLVAKNKDDSVLTKFVYYYFVSKMYLLDAGFKGAGLKHISKKYINKINVTFPIGKDIQQKIISILEKAEETKRLRAQADELTQKLIQSVFMEMFGDPANNPNGFDQVKLGDIGDVSSGLTLNGQRRNNKQNLYPYLRVANVFRNKFNLSEIKNIHVSNSELDRFLLKKNDVLIVEGHGNIEEIGRSAVWNGQISNCVHQNHIIKVRLNEKYISPFFVSYFLNMYGNNGYFSSKSRTTSGLNTISTNKVKNTKICLPPIDLQKKFERIVVNMKQIQDIQKPSKQHIEILFNSLVQKAFKGELIK